MEDKRDWQKDMELCEQTDGPWSRELLIAEQPDITIHWLQQYEAEKHDKVHWMCKYQADAQRFQDQNKELTETKAREQKLKEAIEEALRDATKWENPYEGYGDLQRVLSSLYPKEAEA